MIGITILMLVLLTLTYALKFTTKQSKNILGIFAGCDPCPTGVIPSVAEVVCTPDWTRISRLAFQKNTIPPDTFTAAQIIDQAVWTTKIAAVNDTKVTLTPIAKLKNVATPTQEMIATTDTPDGTSRALGTIRAPFTAMLENLTHAQATSLRQLFCHNLRVYFIDANGNVINAKAGIAGVDNAGYKMFGKVIMSEPTIDGALQFQPLNYMIQFTLEDLFWYTNGRTTAAPFLNIV